MLTIPRAPLVALYLLESAGYPAYLVGGGLRDALRGQTPHDWDVTTAALPDAMLEIFSAAGYRTVPTGLAHGTVTLLVDHTPVECTTYRIDGDYTDARHPDRVVFSDRIADDLSRRDFTVNAMAARLPNIAQAPLPTTDRSVDFDALDFVDFFGGREDLSHGILRCVGDPVTRLTEDALRILRAVRFCAQLSMTPDPLTEHALRTCRAGLSRISVERIANELWRLLACPVAAPALMLAKRCRLLSYLLPGINASTLTNARITKIDVLPPRPALRLSWLLAASEGSTAKTVCDSLKLSKADKEIVTRLIASLARPLPTDEPSARRYLAQLGPLAEDALLLAAADAATEGEANAVVAAQSLVTRVRGQKDPLTVSDLALSGRELAEELELHGPAIGHMLAALLEAVLDDPSLNTKNALLTLAREMTDDQ